jgi:hypothetical protein
MNTPWNHLSISSYGGCRMPFVSENICTSSIFSSEPYDPGILDKTKILHLPTSSESDKGTSRYGLPTPVNPSACGKSSSTSSTGSSSVPDALVCHVCEDDMQYAGKYRIGNLHRHMRLKHGIDGKEREYPCKAHDCPKTYRRQDARLKHYRKMHPELCSGLPVSRK